jgi:hypothetical protein
MKDQTEERWFQLSQLAHLEQDPDKLLALTTEINRLLDDQQKVRKREGSLPTFG